MKRCLVFALVFSAQGCSFGAAPEENGDDPSGQQVGDVGAWCDTTCARLEVCPEVCDCYDDTCTCTGGIGDDCAEECREELESYDDGGAECADYRRALMSCIDEIRTCEMFYENTGCTHLEEPRNCGGSSVEPVAPPVPAGVVTCRAGSGGGTAGAAGGGNVSAFSCMAAYEDCTDGARYQVVCDGTNEHATCNCFRAGTFTGSFEQSPASCPVDAQLNAGCGWNLYTGF
jgi:hypothetical protein